MHLCCFDLLLIYYVFIDHSAVLAPSTNPLPSGPFDT